MGTQEEIAHHPTVIAIETETQVRVVAPDVSGGFGPKFVFHPEELAIAVVALRLRAPVKWIEDPPGADALLHAAPHRL